MMSTMKYAVVITVSLVIVGCGDLALRNRSNDYLLSQEMPPMVVPEEKDSSVVGELYAIPDIPETGAASSNVFRVPRPLPLSENVFEETVRIETFGSDRWIAINKPPAEVWPRVRNILTRSGVPTTRADAPNGILETGWLQFKDDQVHSHRFRFNIEPGVGIKSTEIRLVQSQVPKGSENNAGEWPQRSVNDARGQELMGILSSALVSDISSGSVSLLAQNIGGDDKVKVVISETEEPYIKMQLDYDRAWSSLMHSLSKGGFSVVDKNQTSGLVIVDFDEAPSVGDAETFFDSLFGMVLETKEAETARYQVFVKHGEQAVEVRIVDQQNSNLDQGLSAKLLRIIRTNLT